MNSFRKIISISSISLCGNRLFSLLLTLPVVFLLSVFPVFFGGKELLNLDSSPIFLFIIKVKEGFNFFKYQLFSLNLSKVKEEIL